MLDLLYEKKPFEISTTCGERLNERVLSCLRPGCRVDRQDQELALGDNGCKWMQQLHPGGQGGCVDQQQCVDRSCSSKRYRQPENGAGDYVQGFTRREISAFPEHPSHSAFKHAMDCLLEYLVADCLSDPGPFLANELAPLLTLFLRNRQARR